MTDDELRAAAELLVRRSCVEQGLPEKITDPTVLRNVAVLFGPVPVKQKRKRRRRESNSHHAG